jgi:hypothetical protein
MRAFPIAQSPPEPLSHRYSPCLFPLVRPDNELPSFSSAFFPSATKAPSAAILSDSFFEGFFEALLDGLASALHIQLPTTSAPSSSTRNSASILLCSFPPLLFLHSFESGFALSLRLFLARSLRDSAILIHFFPLSSSFPSSLLPYHSRISAISPSLRLSIYSHSVTGERLQKNASTW